MTWEDVAREFQEMGSPSHDNLERIIEKYPHFAEELMDLAATWIVETMAEEQKKDRAMTTLTLTPDNPLFSDFDPGKLSAYESIEVSLGINPAFSQQLTGDGDTPCWVCPKLKEGGHAGMASGPGFVVNLDSEKLVAAGFSEKDIWILGKGANLGCYLDPDKQKPICGDCAAAAAHVHFSDDEEPCEDCDNESKTSLFVLLEEEKQDACYSCVQMIKESDRQTKEREEG